MSKQNKCILFGLLVLIAILVFTTKEIVPAHIQTYHSHNMQEKDSETPLKSELESLGSVNAKKEDMFTNVDLNIVKNCLINKEWFDGNYMGRQKDNTCTVLSVYYCSQIVSPQNEVQYKNIYNELKSNFCGSSKEDIDRYFDKYIDCEYIEKINEELVKEAIDNGQPISCAVRTNDYYDESHNGKHVITIVGYTNEDYIVIDTNFEDVKSVPKEKIENSLDFAYVVHKVYSAQKFDYVSN